MTDRQNDTALDASLNAEERSLGMDASITRRDFLNASALGAGAALIHAAAPSLARASESSPVATSNTQGATGAAWTGYSGVGDYAKSNGNTWEVVSAGHGIRDSLYESRISAAQPTGETFDLVIVGGGYSGVVAAYTFLEETKRKGTCLILDNHAIPGGEAKRNEFNIRGQRLIGPQGSNESVVPQNDGSLMAKLWKNTGMPREF